MGASERGQGLGRAMLAAAEIFARDMRTPAVFLHVVGTYGLRRRREGIGVWGL